MHRRSLGRSERRRSGHVDVGEKRSSGIRGTRGRRVAETDEPEKPPTEQNENEAEENSGRLRRGRERELGLFSPREIASPEKGKRRRKKEGGKSVL